MHTLSCKAPYIRFTNAGVMLFTTLSLLPKLATKVNMSHPIVMPVMHNQTDWELHRLCVRCAPNKYLQRTGDVRQQGTTQLFVAYGRQDKGKPIHKQQLSKWLLKCIKLSYDKHDLPTPDGVKGHQAHKMAVTYADMAGADPRNICDAACWANTGTFAKFYPFDTIALSDAEFGRRVLMLASFSTVAPTLLGQVRIPQKHYFLQ